jgi:hypothetical protein
MANAVKAANKDPVDKNVLFKKKNKQDKLDKHNHRLRCGNPSAGPFLSVTVCLNHPIRMFYGEHRNMDRSCRRKLEKTRDRHLLKSACPLCFNVIF